MPLRVRLRKTTNKEKFIRLLQALRKRYSKKEALSENMDQLLYGSS